MLNDELLENEGQAGAVQRSPDYQCRVVGHQRSADLQFQRFTVAFELPRIAGTRSGNAVRCNGDVPNRAAPADVRGWRNMTGRRPRRSDAPGRPGSAIMPGASRRSRRMPASNPSATMSARPSKLTTSSLMSGVGRQKSTDQRLDDQRGGDPRNIQAQQPRWRAA